MDSITTADEYLDDSLPYIEGQNDDDIEVFRSLLQTDLTPSHVFDPPADLNAEYFSTGNQVRSHF